MSPIPITIQFSIGARSVVLAENERPAWAGLRNPSSTQTLRLFGGDRVLRCLGNPELDHGLRLDLDGFAGLRITSDAGFAMRFHQASQAGQNEHAVLFCFLNSHVSQLL